MGRRATILAGATALLFAAACRQDMHDQPRLEAFEASSFFADGLASRTPPAGTVARGRLDADTHLVAGRVDGRLVETFPFPIDGPGLQRGRQRYEIFCSPCHGATGSGDGMIVERGLPVPPSFHERRLRDATPGYIFDVVTNGFGMMFSYASRVPAADRWLIVAYIRALQLSRDAPASRLTPDELQDAVEEER